MNHPFITGAPFYPRYSSMQAADFDVVVPEEEKEGMSSKTVGKYSNILQRYVKCRKFFCWKFIVFLSEWSVWLEADA